MWRNETDLLAPIFHQNSTVNHLYLATEGLRVSLALCGLYVRLPQHGLEVQSYDRKWKRQFTTTRNRLAKPAILCHVFC